MITVQCICLFVYRVEIITPGKWEPGTPTNRRKQGNLGL